MDPPECLKGTSINLLLKTADEMEAQGKEKFAYYCRMGAVTAGVNALGTVPKSSEPVVSQYVEVLLDRVEKDAAKFDINPAEEVENLRQLQSFGLDLFNKSFKEDARKAVNKGTILQYRNAAVLLEVVTLLAHKEDDVLLPKVNEMSLWAKSRISYMLREIKAGRVPEPPQQAEVDDLELGEAFAAFMNAPSSSQEDTPLHGALSSKTDSNAFKANMPENDTISARTNSQPTSAREYSSTFKLPEVPTFHPIQNVQYDHSSSQAPLSTANQMGHNQIPNLLNSPNAPGSMDTSVPPHDSKKMDAVGDNYNQHYPRKQPEPFPKDQPKSMTSQVKSLGSSFKEEEAKFNDASEFTRFALAAMREKNGPRAVEFLNQAIQRLMIN